MTPKWWEASDPELRAYLRRLSSRKGLPCSERDDADALMDSSLENLQARLVYVLRYEEDLPPWGRVLGVAALRLLDLVETRNLRARGLIVRLDDD